MNPLTAGLSDQEWESIITQLKAFFRAFTRDKHWFRGPDTETFLKGKSIDDYVYEAIGRYLRNPEKFDQRKGTLIDYLKYNLLRGLISNDLTNKENEKTKAVYENVLRHDADDHSTAYYDRLVPITEALFNDEIDYDIIMDNIQEAVKKNTICENIFLGLYLYGMTRAQVIEEFGMTAQEYDNGNRRLKTIIRTVALKYNIDN
jgi:hypothetical protein